MDSMNMNDLAAMAAKVDSQAVPVQHGSMQPTQNGVPVAPATAEKEKKEKIDLETALARVASGVSLTKEDAMVSPDSPKGLLQAVMQKRAMICGFVVPKDHTLKFSCTKNKAGQYDIVVKDNMATKISGIIIRYPEALYKAIIKCNSSRGVDLSYKYEEGDAEYFANTSDLAYVTKVMGYDDGISWINKVCGGKIAEAENLYTIVKRKNSKTGEITVKDRADCPQLYWLDSQLASLMKKAASTNEEDAVKKLRKQFESKKASVLFRLKSGYRPKLLTQNNYIALAKAVVDPVGKMSADEVAQRNKFYIERMFTSKNEDNGKYGALADDARGLVTKNGSEFTSRFFQTEGDSALFGMHIAPWYDKYSAINAKDLRLPRLEEVTGSKEGSKPRTREQFQDIEITGTGYRFDPEGEHKAVYEATQKTLTGDMIMAFKAELATRTRTGSAAKQIASVNADVAFQGLLAMLTV